MSPSEKDIMFSIGFVDGKTGRALLPPGDSTSEAEIEYRKGYAAGQSAAARSKGDAQ